MICTQNVVSSRFRPLHVVAQGASCVLFLWEQQFLILESRINLSNEYIIFLLMDNIKNSDTTPLLQEILT